ncbi:hypothetical protein LTR50_007847 [Elasticomyces elasticus]|nr:hypothetical protein LTR50_007847 [Elasticomyces elasticus]
MAEQLPHRMSILRRESRRHSALTSNPRRGTLRQSVVDFRHPSETPSIQNIIIPANLLQTVRTHENETWQPGQALDGPGDPGTNHFTVNSPQPQLRYSSLPVIHDDSSDSHGRRTQPSISTSVSDSTTSEGQDGEAKHFKLLTDFSFNDSKLGLHGNPADYEEVDPMSAIPADDLGSVPQIFDRSDKTEPDLERASKPTPGRRGTLAAIRGVRRNTVDFVRRSSIFHMYEKAKLRREKLQRKKWVQVLFEYTFYAILLAFVYFVLVGVPLWNGAVWWLWWIVAHKFVLAGGFAITVGLAAIYALSPLLIFFEPDPPMPNHPPGYDLTQVPFVKDTALLIPCYKSASIIGNTLEAALKIFPARNIFVVANGNSPEPLDNTEQVCLPYGVNHIWSPVGSKLVAQFVGCYAAKGFKAQDLEYKISGLQRAFAGKVGSATFAHGAIAMWETEFAIKTFHQHPGFSVSEDWFFGHVARQLGSRIQMCSSIFVETETPAAVFFSSGGSRGGFGEMTVYKQRFTRWNFFFVSGLWYDLAYIFGSWRLGWWEIGAKFFVFQGVYETLLYLLTPFMLPISLIVRPAFCGYLLVGTIALYLVNIIILNEIHLRRKRESCGFVATYLYYMPYKIVLTGINVASCYWALYKYARYFAQRHPKIIEDASAVEVVLRLEEHDQEQTSQQHNMKEGGGRRMTVTAIGVRASISSIRPALAGQQQQYRHPSMMSLGGDALVKSRSAERSGSASEEQRVGVIDFATMAPIQEVRPRARLMSSYQLAPGALGQVKEDE